MTTHRRFWVYPLAAALMLLAHGCGGNPPPTVVSAGAVCDYTTLVCAAGLTCAGTGSCDGSVTVCHGICRHTCGACPAGCACVTQGSNGNSGYPACEPLADAGSSAC